jgi:NADH:ubiquinone oxidoreductase subunit 5 (subunit L)/multisubunit Na+/H+ antiporter MnhA subunit
LDFSRETSRASDRKGNGFLCSCPCIRRTNRGKRAGDWHLPHPSERPDRFEVLRDKFYFDEFYAWLINWTQELLARVSAFFDRWIIDTGAVDGSSRGIWGIGALLRLIQLGNLQAYVFLFGLGVIAVIYFAVFR